MKGKDYWYGKEVEGRLFGLYTLFNRNGLGIITSKVQHLYSCVLFECSSSKYKSFVFSMSKKSRITVPRTAGNVLRTIVIVLPVLFVQ